MHLQENTLFDLDLGVKVTQNVAQYPLHHVTYSATKFEVAMANGLGGDTFTRNMTDRRTHAHTDALTVGYLLGTYNVRKSSQENVSTQQIPVIFYRINLILSLLAPFICK